MLVVDAGQSAHRWKGDLKRQRWASTDEYCEYEKYMGRTFNKEALKRIGMTKFLGHDMRKDCLENLTLTWHTKARESRGNSKWPIWYVCMKGW